MVINAKDAHMTAILVNETGICPWVFDAVKLAAGSGEFRCHAGMYSNKEAIALSEHLRQMGFEITIEAAVDDGAWSDVWVSWENAG